MVTEVLENLGKNGLNFFCYLGSLGILSLKTIASFFNSRFRGREILKQMDEFGNKSFPMVALVSVFIGMILAMQSASALRMVGAQLYVGSLVSLSAVREMSAIFVALVVASRVGAAITAEIGTMQITEQIDALRSLAVNPVNYLVAPRLLAAVITLPFLTLFSIFISILGGWFVAVYGMKLGSNLYLYHAFKFIYLKDFLISFLKAFIFGFIIVIVSCRQGFETTGGAEGVGKVTTFSVVFSFLLIILANLIITAFFYFL